MPEREPHRGDHVDDEEGQGGELAEDRGDGDGHDDGQDGDAHGEERGHQGAEDQDQHDHRGGQPELQLPVGEVGLRELGEVVVEGVDPGDVDLERRPSESAATTSSITSTIPVSGSCPSTSVTTAACPSSEMPDPSAA